MIKAISFDFWDTIAIDESDEPKRKAKGLLSKPVAREKFFIDEINKVYPKIGTERIVQAFHHANEIFQLQWKNHYFTPSVRERFLELYKFLQIEPTPNFSKIVEDIERMEVEIPPDPVPDLHPTLKELAQSYKLCLTSDTIHTPGHQVRKILDLFDVTSYFSALVFSDEVGAAKPAALIFESVSKKLGNIPLSEIVHIGDREANDVSGPQKVGMKAILFTGIVDRGSRSSFATQLCAKFSDLPKIIAQFDQYG